jgi:hypothetical protein
VAAQTIQRADTYAESVLVAREELERVAEVVEYRRYDGTLALLEQRPATPDETASHERWERQAAKEELRAQGEKALGKNKTFLDLDPPTNAQNGAQIEALTKQMNGLIRQVLQLFDDIDDSVLEV